MKRIKRAGLAFGALGMLAMLGAMVETAQAACGTSDRMKIGKAACLHMVGEKQATRHVISAINLCAPLGQVVGKADIKYWSDKTFYLDGPDWESQISPAKAQGMYCCTDGDNLCNPEQVISTQKCRDAWHKSPAGDKRRCRFDARVDWLKIGNTETTEGLRTHFSCTVVKADCIMKDGTYVRLQNYTGPSNGGPLLPEKLKKMDFYDVGGGTPESAVSFPAHRVSPPAYTCGGYFCNVSDFGEHWDRSPAVTSGKCLGSSNPYTIITMDAQDGRSTMGEVEAACWHEIDGVYDGWQQASIRVPLRASETLHWCKTHLQKGAC